MSGSLSKKELSWWESDDEDVLPVTQVPSPEKSSFWTLMGSFIGPGIMIAIAYIDPGNYATDLQGGSRFEYKLLWSIAWAHAMGFIFQVLVLSVALATGRTLSEECALEYPVMKVFLWLSAETSSIAADVGYIMGTATALLVFFKIPLLWGVLISALDTLLFLAIQALGHRKMELFCALLGSIVAICSVGELCILKPPLSALLGFIPFWGGIDDGSAATPLLSDFKDYTLALTGIFGACVCPPNFFLHSALVQSRRFAPDERVDSKSQMLTAVKFNAMETGLGIFFACLINCSIMMLAGKFYFNPLEPKMEDDLTHLANFLKIMLGGASKNLFALSLFCGGQSASVTGTLASQFILEGFMNVRLKPWVRRSLIRVIAVVPAFLLTFFYGGARSARIIAGAQVVVNFVVPFTLIPILKFVSSPVKMGEHALSLPVQCLLWVMLIFVTSLNLVTAQQTLTGIDQVVGWITFAVLVVPYAGVVGYLIWKPITVPPSEFGLASGYEAIIDSEGTLPTSLAKSE